MFSVVKDAYEVAEFDGLWGRDRLILLRSDAGLVVPVAELRRILIYAPDEPPEDPDRALADLYRVPCRPVASEETILLLEMLGVIRRGAHRPDGSPPRVVSLRHAEQIVCERWDEDPGVSARKRCVARHILAAIERRRLESFERVELRVLRLGSSSAARVYALRCKRIEVPVIMSGAPGPAPPRAHQGRRAAYGSSLDVPSLRAEIRRRHPDLGADSPFRFKARTDVVGRARFALEGGARPPPASQAGRGRRLIVTARGRGVVATGQTLTLYAGLNAEVEGEAARGAACKWGFISLAGAERILQGLPRFGDELLVPFRRQRLALEGADAAEIEAAAPLPLAPARRIAIFTKREWLTADEAEGGAADGGADGEAEGLEPEAAPEASEGEGEGEYALPEGEWSRELRAQMKLFEEWRTRAINPDRAGAAVERSTALTNDVGTVGRFLGYLAAREEVRPLSFDVFSRGGLVDLWMRFLTFLKEERKLTAGTLSGYTSSIIMAAAFAHSRTGAATGSEGPHARALKNVKAQLEKEKREERKWRPRGENWVE
eukprot:tig00000540_g1937.t1